MIIILGVIIYIHKSVSKTKRNPFVQLIIKSSLVNMKDGFCFIFVVLADSVDYGLIPQEMLTKN